MGGIEDEDESVTSELEAEVDVSGEFIRQVLADHLKRYGPDRVERIPDGVHSGFVSSKPGFFFHFRVRGQHLWRLYDEQSGEVLESLLTIYKRIRCSPETPGRTPGATCTRFPRRSKRSSSSSSTRASQRQRLRPSSSRSSETSSPSCGATSSIPPCRARTP